MLRKRVWYPIVLTCTLAAYFCLWPVPIEALAWQAPQAPGNAGPHRANHQLVGVGKISLQGEAGPIKVLVKAGLGEPVSFPNAVIVSNSGKIYFSDSSQRFAPAHWGSTQAAALLDVLEQSATGRVLEYDPGARRLRVLAEGFSLANAIVLSRDGRSLFVAESGKYRVWKIDTNLNQADIAQEHAGARVLLDNLPGFPDNLTRAAEGQLWLGLAGQRNELDAMSEFPFLRELALRIPRALWSTPKPYGHVIAFSEDGTITRDLQDPTGSSATTTGVTEAGHRLYIHNVDGAELAWKAQL